MKKLFTAGAMAMLLVISGPVHAGGFSGSVNGVLGTKQIDNDDVRPRHLGMLGVMSDFQFGSAPIRLAADLLLAGRTKEIGDDDVNLSTVELAVGGRFVIPTGSDFHPFVGAGLNLTSAHVSIDYDGGGSESDSDGTVGGYATLGAYYSIIGRINVGAMYRYSIAEVELFDEKDDIDAHHWAIMVGYSW